MKDELKKFGLTENEAKVYLALVELGEGTATPIKNKTDLHTSRVYEALNSLIEKGLVSYFMKNNIKQFKAQNPDVMFDILDDKREQLLNIIPQIKALQTKEQSNYSISLYEGYKAFKQLYDHLLFKLTPKDEILVLGAQQESKHFLGFTFFKQYTLRRIQKKVKVRLLFNHDALETAKTYSNMAYTKVKVLPPGVVFPTAMDIYPDKVSILLLKEKPLVFHIDCKDVADSYKSYFEFLWGSAKEV
jgi:sugar-specific transcriptional regulator TrmB